MSRHDDARAASTVPARASAVARVATALVATLLVAGCTSIPTSSTPSAIGTIPPAGHTSGVQQPAPGRDPDLLLRDFLAASADPTDRHAAARQYLTPNKIDAWDDGAGTTVVDKVDLLVEHRTADEVTYRVRATRILGDLEDGGRFVARDGAVDNRITLVKTDGEWRIDDLDDGVLMDQAQFLNGYTRRSLFFTDPTDTTLVPDPRWLPDSLEDIQTELVDLLIAGPKRQLADAVHNHLDGARLTEPVRSRGPNTGAVGSSGATVSLADVDSFEEVERRALAAQIVTTLSRSDVSGPFVVDVDGRPLDAAFADGWTEADVAALDPLVRQTQREDVGLHALQNGRLSSVRPTGTEPVAGPFGRSESLRSIALSDDGTLGAGVSETGRPEPATELLVAPVESGEARPVASGRMITRPTWGPGGRSLWAVIDGTRIVRIERDPQTGETRTDDVVADEIRGLGGQISELRLTSDGVRAALVIDGRVFVAVVVRDEDGAYTLRHPQEIAKGLGGPALALDWSTSDTLVVSRAASDVPVVQVAVDGSRVDGLPSRNLTPPVTAIEASPSTEYVADANAVFQLNNSDPAGDRYWREVPGLTVRAVPVLPG